jgi:acetyltransferase-like isoleucine patch superfamily enzyme
MRAPGWWTGRRLRAALRVAWAIATFAIVQLVVCGIAALPVVVLWRWLLGSGAPAGAGGLFLLGLAVFPSYVLFALALMVVSPCATRLLGWRTPRDAEMSIAEVGWPLLDWARYMASIHVVRAVAGTLFRGSPVWAAYLRLCGARLGRRVYVASLSLSDYNLLEFEDGVVIGADVHLSGHTVEHGIVKTAAVRLGRDVTIGVGSVVEIGVEAGDGCQVGALSFVPKYTRLLDGTVYVGIPVRPIGDCPSDARGRDRFPSVDRAGRAHG